MNGARASSRALSAAGRLAGFCSLAWALCAAWSPVSAAPPPGVGPTLVQYQTYQTQGTAGENLSSAQFNTPTTAGNTIWVAVTISDYAGVHTLAVTDTQGNTYTLLNQENDGSPGSQTVAHFYASNIVGDTTVPNTVTLSSSYENYRGLLIVEIAGTATPPLLGSAANIQDGLPAGTNNVTSTPISIAASQTPALMVALSMNTSGGSSDLGGSGYGGPAAGGSFTQVAQFWNWGVNLATFETAVIPSFNLADGGTGAPTTESFAALFSAPDTDSYVTMAAIFLPTTAPPVQPPAPPPPSIAASPNPVARGGSTAAAAGPALVQYTTHQTPANAGEGNSPVAFRGLTQAGDTLWVAVTVSDYAAVHKISVTDTQGNHFKLLDQKNDHAHGYQTVAHFHAANIAGDTTAPDIITVAWPWDTYKGVLIAEITGTTAPPEAHSGNIQDRLPEGSNNITSGMLAASKAPVLVLALSMNTSGGTSDTGGSGAGAPAPGSGFTQLGQFWSWGVNLATFEAESLSAPINMAATFSAPDTDSYVTVVAVFH
ncbi:MAG: hypothetical protein ACLPTF_00790 [Steroidobacteraceae bacterium]